MRRVALLLGKMEYYGLLDYGWQNIIEKRRMLVSKDGKPIMRTDQSTALANALRRQTAANKAICDAVKEIAMMNARE